MRKARAKVVAFGGKEHLRLMGKTSKGLRMKDLIAIALEVIA